MRYRGGDGIENRRDPRVLYEDRCIARKGDADRRSGVGRIVPRRLSRSRLTTSLHRCDPIKMHVPIWAHPQSGCCQFATDLHRVTPRGASVTAGVALPPPIHRPLHQFQHPSRKTSADTSSGTAIRPSVRGSGGASVPHGLRPRGCFAVFALLQDRFTPPLWRSRSDFCIVDAIYRVWGIDDQWSARTSETLFP